MKKLLFKFAIWLIRKLRPPCNCKEDIKVSKSIDTEQEPGELFYSFCADWGCSYVGPCSTSPRFNCPDCGFPCMVVPC